MPPPNPILLYRITHIANLPYILRHGILLSSNPNRDPDYVQIGRHQIIEGRRSRQVPVSPGGYVSEYVPFYLGPRPPMLYNIVTGWEIQRYPAEEIVYLISDVDTVLRHQLPFVFTDGNAHAHYTTFYSDIADLVGLDWVTILGNDWGNTETDPDRKNRKQAEFLVKANVPVSCLFQIATYNEHVSVQVANILAECGLGDITVSHNKSLYY